MDSQQSVSLSEDELEMFLGTGGTGTLAFGTDRSEPPYAIPVSYGFDSETRQFFFRLAHAPRSDELPSKPTQNPVTFVTFSETPTGWHSAIASGTLTGISEPAVDDVAAEALRRIHIPLVDIYDHPTKEVEFAFFRLDPETLSGRKEAHVDD
ncbi:pyridoxamine 5'-phosphate oxidase family protein [Natronocalculus amylovorans]|uniref:Pyridoxamine 5'-phosphate oxidase family protein n=1 Tax=Natronocalculus amylovorans TaxID=2917812 RepID=A0AAE3FX90_9EURY|nr:pyridoxamine 5'-phosphate oxidase family protein [Natronocalculus amylovorans]MCL9816693.1 pyridoxamine 5'-phosphate oxidase family protein [Natronocalculus amylovorans]